MMTSFSGQLACPVEFGHIFLISGKSTCNANRIEVNLAADKCLEEIPFHLSVRYRENVVVRNTKICGVFGAEERSPGYNNVANPLLAGKEFKIYILVGVDRFHISLNDQPFTDYSFRSALNRISGLQVLKDVEFIRHVDHRKSYPLPYPPVQSQPTWSTFSNDLPIPYTVGHVVIVSGIALGNPQGNFVIRFLVGQTEKQGLHFNVRFPQREVVRNHNFRDNMEFVTKEEERYGGFPFAFSHPFKIAFGFGERGFKIAVNGSSYCEWAYRGDFDTYSGIKCTGKEGLVLNITEVDHVIQDRTLTNFEQLSTL